MPFYTVYDHDGNRLDEIAAASPSPHDIQNALNLVAPGRTWDLSPDQRRVVLRHPLTDMRGRDPNNTIQTASPREVAVTPTPPPPTLVTTNTTTQRVEIRPPPDPDPEIPYSQIGHRPIRIGDDDWWFQYINGGRPRMRLRNRIFLGSAPLKTFTPGTTPGTRALNNWRRNPEMILDPHNPPRFVIDRNAKCAWVFGQWRRSYVQAFERLLGFQDFKPLAEDSYAALDRLIEDTTSSNIRLQRERLQNTVRQVESYQQALLRTIRERESLQKVVDAYVPPEPGRAKRLVSKILKVDGVEKVSIAGQELSILTKHIYIDADVDPSFKKERTRYDIGKFKITINIQSGIITFKNLTHQVDGREHPHIPYPTGACFGEIAGNIPTFISKLMLTELVHALIVYLRSVNVQDRYGETIVRWPVAKEEKPAEKPMEREEGRVEPELEAALATS